MAFTIVFKNICIMLAYMAMGYTLVKTKLADPSHGRSFSGFLVYCATPGMIISYFQALTYDPAEAKQMILFFLVSLIVQLIFFGLFVLLLGKRLEQGKYRILTIGSFMGNVGFFGAPILSAIFPGQPLVTCYCMMYATSMNILIFTIGEYLISRDKKYASVKRAILNPTAISMMVALPLYFLKISLPAPVVSIADMLRSMTAPICMVVLGLRLASMKVKEVFGEPFAYLVSALKLLIFPLFAYACVAFLPWFDYSFKITMLIASACPCASVILSLAELHSCEQKSAAYTVLVASILCVITIPMLTYIFVR